MHISGVPRPESPQLGTQRSFILVTSRGIMPSKARGALFSAMPALTGLSVFAAYAFLYCFSRDYYFTIMNFSSIDVYKRPFIDSEFMYAMKECWLNGVDIYKAIPCDNIPGNRMAYSPLWPRLPFLPSDKDIFTLPVAIASDVLVILSTLILPRAQTRDEVILVVMALASPPLMFALERNNIDVWMYLSLCGAVLLCRGTARRRAIGYSLIVFAGLLKYYPISWLGMAVRERLGVFVFVAAGSSLALSGFVLAFHSEILKSLANVPVPAPFSPGFGLVEVPLVLFSGLSLAGRDFAAWAGWSAAGAWAALAAFVIIGAARKGTSRDFRGWLSGRDARKADWLFAGSIAVAACYLAGPNVAYREIYMLPVVTSLLATTRASAAGTVGRSLSHWPLGIVALMWSSLVSKAFVALTAGLGWSSGAGAVVQLAVWTVEKVGWILLARVLLAIVIAGTLDSRAFRDLTRWWSAHRGRRKARQASGPA